MKKILITGSGSGLGKEAAIALSRLGHKVYATTHYIKEAHYLNDYAEKNNLSLEAFKLDILLKEDREKILNYDIDTYISNAAIGDSGSVAEVSVDRIRSVFETNIFCNIELTKLVIQKMIDNNITGRIIFVSSLCGRRSIPFLSPYCASKFALNGFITALRKEMKLLSQNKIEVCIIEPGAYATGFNQINYMKKYSWMKENSYFKNVYKKLLKKDKKFWSIIEVKKFDSIINMYIKAVTDKEAKLRYTAPKSQAIFTKIANIFDL